MKYPTYFLLFGLNKAYHFAVFSQTSEVSNPLGDDRFSAMFSNPDFQVDEESEVRTKTRIRLSFQNLLFPCFCGSELREKRVACTSLQVLCE